MLTLQPEDPADQVPGTSVPSPFDPPAAALPQTPVAAPVLRLTPEGQAQNPPERPQQDATEDQDWQTVNVMGKKIPFTTVASLPEGRRLIELAQTMKRGEQYGFWDSIIDGISVTSLPFMGFLSNAGGSMETAKKASEAFRKAAAGEEPTLQEAIAGELVRREGAWKSEGTWGSVFGSIIAKAPGFYAEMGGIGKGLEVLRTAIASRAAASGAAAAPRILNHAALTRGVKIGMDETASAAVDAFADAAVAEGKAATKAAAVKLLASDSAVRTGTVDYLTGIAEDLMKGPVNSAIDVNRWSPGLAHKVAAARAQTALDSAIALRSSEHWAVNACKGLAKSFRDSLVSGIVDAGSWGSEAATIVTTAHSSAGKAALQGLMDLTVGSAARGTAMFLPREAVMRPVGKAVGAVGQQQLGIEQAAWQNNDPELMSRAETMGMFLDLVEYVSEASGRGFNQLARAGGLAVAPKLLKPAAVRAGMTQVTGAKLVKDAAGELTGVNYVGLFEDGSRAEVGGVIRRFCDKLFGGRALKDNVSADRYTATVKALKDRGIAEIADPRALQQTVDSGAIAANLAPEIRTAIGSDVPKFVTDAVRAANKARLEGLKIHGFLYYYVADFLARHNIDAVKAGDLFFQMGYDGVIGEMFEERYADVLTALFGLNAEKDQSLKSRLGRAVRDLFAVDDNGHFKFRQLTAEAAGFAVPLVVRAGVMRGVAALGGNNALSSHREWASLANDVLRYDNGLQQRKGDFIVQQNAQIDRANAEAREVAERLAADAARRASGSADGPLLTDNEREELRGKERSARIAAQRLSRYRDHVVESLAADVTDDTMINVAPITDRVARLSEEQYNLVVHPTDAQMRRSASAYRRLLDGAAQAGQTLFKAENPTPDESLTGFRRIAHNAASWALRLGGTLATGEVGFMTHNPAEFMGNDQGMPASLQLELKREYGRIYHDNLESMSQAGTPSAEVDIEAVHAKSLEDFRQTAADLTAAWFAAHNVYMFTDAEIADAAMQSIARDQGYYVDAEHRQFSRTVGDSTQSVSFDEFERVNHDAIEAMKREDAEKLFRTITHDTSRSADVASVVGNVIHIPKGLPTHDQAVMAQVLRLFPALRRAAVVVDVDPNKPLDDQLLGPATRQEWLDRIVDSVLPSRRIETAADYRAAMAKIESPDFDVDPALLATVARDLNIQYRMTEQGIRDRNRAVVRNALLTVLTQDPDVVMFSKPGERPEASESDPLGTPFSTFVSARRTGAEWRVNVGNGPSGIVSAATPEELADKLAPLGFSRANPRVVYASAQAISTGSAVDMIQAIGAGALYGQRMRDAVGENDEAHLDPAYRVDPSTGRLPTPEKANADRAKEDALSALFDRNHHQMDWRLYLEPGESADDGPGPANARARMQDASDAWHRQYGESDVNGEKVPVGYKRVADALLREFGVHTPGHSVSEVADTQSRGKYVLPISVLASLGSTGNIYVRIDHEQAQDYETALLNASLTAAFRRGYSYLTKVFDAQIKDFLHDANEVMATVAADAKRQGKTDLAEDIENLRMATTAVPRKGMKRRVSPQTFSWFVSAFNLFRTEIRDESRTREDRFRGERRFHDRRSAALGPHAAALEAVAPRIRQLPNFVKWTAAVDFVLGGDGLEGAGTNPSGRGLQMYYALFAPTEDHQDFQKAVEAAFPGKSYSEWAAAVTAAAHDSLHVPQQPPPQQPPPQQPPPQQPPPQPDGLGALRAVQAVQTDMNLTPEEAIRVIDGAAPAETRSDEGGGNSAEDLLDSVPVSETREDTDDGNDDEEIAYSDDDQFAVAPLSPETAEDVLFDPSRLVEKQETQELLPSDYERAATAFGRLALIDRGRKLTMDEFRDFVEFLVPDMRLDNRTRIVESYAALVSKNPDLSQQDGWSWQPDDEDDEGVTVDGFEGNNARAVDMLRSDAFTRFLTLMQFVSPSTGKDFQPFVEDLRSSVRAAEWLAPGDDRLLKEAYGYLDGILNPRANSKFDSAPLREAWFNEQLSKMDMGHPDRSLIEMYVREAFLNSQYPSTRPTNLRAALFLSYLMGLSPNVRRQFASLISSSAPAVPMKLRRIDDDPAHPVFVMAPEPPRQGRVSMETATASFGVMANNTVENARAAGRQLVQLYAAAAARGEFAMVHEGKARGIANSEGTGVFQAHAKILAAVFGADSPMVAMLTSIRSNRALLADLQARGNDSELARFGAAFSSDDPGVASPRTMEVLKVDVPAGLPPAALDVIDAVADMVEQAEAKGQPKVLLGTVKQVAVEMFQSGRRFARHVLNTSTGLRGRGTWGQLMGVYSDYKPVSVMRAEVDPERTNKPASSLAITMTGIEPALQVFMDRKDENGYEAVVRKWWPKALDKIPNLLGMARQGLFWPDARGTSIVAKSISKTAFATETLMGCRTAFQYETSDQPVPEWFQRRNMLLVPVYSGDHSSSIMLQVPLAKEFAAAGMDYDTAAELVSKWVGLDLLGADAKRSSTTSMEAPGTSLRGFRHGRDGMLKERNGEYETGHCYVGIVWNPEDGADNEAMLGETLLYGYGARRQRELSKDPRLSQVKVHISGTGGVSRLYTGMLSLIKSLSVARPDDKGGAQFVEESPNRMLMDGFGAKMVDGDEDASTGIVTDYDSVKLMLANHKAMGVDTGTGKTLALMKYVFDERLKEALAAGDVGETLDTAPLDELVGDIPWVDRTDSSRSVPAARLSDLLPGCRLIRTTSKGGKAMYCLQFTADELMAFQVANVAHEASPTWSNMPRNYMTDMMAMSRTLSSDSRLDTALLPGAKRNAEIAAEMVSGWGVVAAAMANDRKSVDNMLWADEEFVDMVENRGEPARRPDGTGYDGRYAAEARRRAYSSYATKHCRNLPVFAIDAALVSNDGWVDTTDGSVRCHFDNAMFRDTLQGARTIAKSERGFFQANKRAALCNLNCTAPWFRHGMYIDMEKLETEFSDRLPGTDSDNPLNPLRRAVLILESVVTDIHAGKTMDADGRTDIREKLAKCLYDHHGTYLADRTIDVMAVQKDPATGKPMRDADGRKIRVKETRRLWRSISWSDLMTKTRSAEGKRMFDRAAVYENMHDGSGKQTLYLGGTMIGVPRTPSGNGSMWMQVARAGLPVTEIVGKDAAGVVQWKSGRDAMVAPDPYTLKILGCDHDGDKAKLYMLQPDRDGHASLASVEGMFGSRVDEAARRMARDGDGSELVQEMLADGTLEYSRRDGKDGPLQLTAQAKRELGNAMVLTLFDMYRSTPVQDVEGSVPLYTGESRDGAGRGSYYGMTKARMLPKEKWDALLAEVGDAKILDENDPRKMVGVPAVAALAQASAQRASDSRALIVSIVAALHHAYAAGVGPFAGWLGSSEEFLDFLYHMDGLSNMTFDDVKEQLCSRLGVAPGMVIPLVAHFMCSANAVGKLPTTDDEFEQAFRKYALGVRDKKSMWHWMYRFSDTGDFEAAALQASGRAVAFDFVNSKHPASKLEGSDRKIYEAVVREASRTRGQDASESVLAGLYNDVATVLNQRRKKHSAPAGVRWWIRVVQNDVISDADADSIVRWAMAMSKLYEAQDFTRATRYAAVDPGADDVQVPEFTDQGLEAVARAFGVTSASEDENRPKPTRRDWQTVRMFAATRLFLKGQGKLLSSRGMEAARGFRDNLNSAFGHYARHAEPGRASMEARFLVAASSMNQLPYGNVQMRAQANAQSIGYAASEFLTLRQMDGSPLTAENAYDVMYDMARAASMYRHGDAKPGTAHVNQTLDWRRTVEAMVDVMARFLKDSTVHKDVPVMDYLRQFSDATATSFSPAVFGPAAEDLSQTRLSLKNMSGAQLGVLHGLVRNIVENKVLDSGAERGSFTTVHGNTRFTPGLYKQSDRVTFALSSASIKAMLAYARKEDEFRAKASGKTGGKKTGKSAWAGLLSETAEAKPAPSDVPIIRELELLEAVFEKMDAKYGKGFTIEPSVLFGQVLPIYATVTSRISGPPMPGSTDLIGMFPGEYTAIARTLSRLDAGRSSSRTLGIAEGLDWDPLSAYRFDEVAADYVSVGDVPSPADIARRIDAGVAAGRDVTSVTVDRTGEQAHVEHSQTLGIFDGNAAVAFQSMLQVLRDQAVEPAPVEPSAPPEPPAPSEAPEPAEPVEPIVPPVSANKPHKRDVAEMANRVGALFKMWDCGRVEYAGGDEFVIRARFHVSPGSDAGATDSAYEASISVSLLPEGEQLRTDDQLREMLKDSPLYRQSLAQKSGVTLEKLEAMSPEAQLELARRNRPVGVTSVKDEVFQIDGTAAGMVAGRITLARQPDADVVFHECFHAVARFMKATGALGSADIAELVKKYGPSAKYGDKWFNEEAAAEDYKAFVQRNRLAETDADNVPDEKTGVFGRILAFVRDLYDVVFAGGHESRDYGNDMERNPLAGVMLTGRATASVESKVDGSFGGRLFAAVKTYITHLDGRLARWHEIADKAVTTETYVPEEIEDRFGNMVPNSKGYSRVKYAGYARRLRDEKDSAEADEIEKELAHTAFAPLRVGSVFENGPARPFDEDPWLPGDPMPDADTAFFSPRGTAGEKAMRPQYRELSREALITQAAGYGVDHSMVGTILDPSNEQGFTRFLRDLEAAHALDGDPAARVAELVDRFNGYRDGRGDGYLKMVDSFLAKYGPKVEAASERRREWTLTPVKPSTADATAKDQRKFNQLGGITKFIGVGAPGTSTAHYAETAFREIANTGSYSANDIVGVSVNGAARKGVGRVPLSDPRIMKELDAATSAGATIVADEKSYRNRSTFNVGEQELAEYLVSRGYAEQDGSGIWRPQAPAPTSEETAEPNGEFENPDFVAMLDSIASTVVDDEAKVMEELEGMGFSDDEMFACAATVPRVRQALRSARVERMNVPYARTNELGMAVGRAIREGMHMTDPGTRNILRSSVKRNLSDADAARMHELAAETVRRVAQVYGMDLSGGDAYVEAHVFRALAELHAGIGAGYVRPDAAKGKRDIMHAERHKGVSSPTRRPGANPDDPFNRAVTAADLAGAVLASSGVRPCDIAEAVIADIDAMARRYGPDRTFHQVLDHLRSVMETLQAEDPTGLVGGAHSRDEDRMGELLKRAGAGLKPRERLSDGSLTPYAVIDEGTSYGPYSEENRALYADHVGTADFQKIMAEVDDALHVVAAAGKFYREIGYTPGASGEEQALGNIPGAENVPPPATPADTMAAMSVAPETLSDPSAEIVAFYDRPWVLAENADAWLDSIVQPTFGGVGIREAMMESRRSTAGFIGRAQHLNQIDAYMYGLNAVPGTPLVAIDPDYSPEFSWRDGRMSHGRGARNAVRFMAYDERPARKDGKPVKTDLDGIRMTDFALKARKVWFQGGKYIVTGVDGITFSTDDFGHDESWWAWDKVQDREKAGRAGGYSDFDKALVRMHRQLSDDAEHPWAAIVKSGEGRYGLYDLAVKEAVAALREAEQRMSSGTLSADEVNDYVLTVLDHKGVVNAVETWLPHKARHGKTSGAFKLDVEKIEKMFLESDAYRTLLDAGRTEKMLSRDEYVRPYRMLMREVKEFLAAHPYLTTGDGSFFHNLSTPLPFVQGSGYFMYMANRTADKTDARKVNEAISKFQPVLVDAVENPVNQLLPAADAGPELLKLVPLLFHVREQDVDSVREAIRRNDYRAVGGLNLTASSTQADLAKAIYLRLSGMLWHAEGTDASSRVGGLDAIRGMVLAYEKAHGQSAVLSGGSGLTDELVHRMTGILPANHQLGHAVMNAVEGLANAYAFKASLISMMTTPDEDGMPTVFVNPREDAVEKSGIPDEIWGSCARWWAAMHGAKYDSSLTGVQNARAVYSQIAARLPKSEFGSLGPSDIDAPSVESMICRKATPIDNSSSAGYALGYAKHLMQSTRQLGGTAARATIHRAWAWSKGLSVSFSYFFPLATRFESPTGAVGALATLGGNVAPGTVRKWARVLSRMQSLLRGKGWITKDFLGERDVRRAMDSSDPYYTELIQWAGSLGLTMSTGVKNPQEQSRGILQRDVRDVVGWVKDRFGSKKAKYVEDAANVMLLRAGDRAFTYHLNATKLAVAAQMYQKLAGEAQAAGVAFDPVRDLKGWTGYINAEIGGIDPLRYAWAHPAAQNLMNTSFFSWQWTLGAWSAGGGDAIIQAFTGRNSVTRQERSMYLMRWMRMGLEVMVGFPIMMQLLSKALGEALTAGMDPDDKDLDEETRRLVRMVRESAWFTWNNEDKARLSHFDLTPLMAGVAARFPKFADYRRNHPFAYALPVLAATAMRKPWLLLGAFPVYSGSDAANQNTRGRHVYMREGKQGWEWLAWFTHPFRQFFSKLAMPVQRLSEGIVGRSLSWLEHPQPWEGQGDLERWINPTAEGATFNLLRAFLPFSVSSLLDAGDAGFLPMMGPVSMGASGSNLVERMTAYLNQWSSNDRRGYAYGRPARFVHDAKYSHLAASRPTIAHLLQEARLNGYGEADAYKLVDAAVNKLVTPLYSDLAKALPTDPDGPFDARRVGMLLRKANRLGRLRDDLGRSVVNRLRKQNSWTTLKPDQRRAMSAAIDLMRSKNPYDISIERFRERAKARGLTLDY